MASRWLRWPRRPPDEAEHDAALTQLTAAFLDMDGRQSAAEAAVAAAAALSERADLSDEWATVRNACYEAAAAYLAVTDRTSEATPTPGAPGAARDLAAEIVRTADLLESARDGLDEFYDHHRRLLDAAVSNAAAVSTDADAALRGAHDVRQLLAGAEARYLEYPSVAAAREELDVATTRLTTARERDELAPTRAAIDGVRQATGAVREALSAAPEREGEAHRAVMSVRTRLDAVSTRTAGLPPLISTLLRDFNAKSSADLVDNEKRVGAHLERSETLLRQAEAARNAHRPEEALARIAEARSELADAEGHVDEVADRLDLLRRVRAEPEQRLRDVRFRLRDAQRLAVDRNAVSEWGSVLDAQAARINRIVDMLDAPHPDYWAYHRSLDEVTTFVANVVNRIRQGAVR